MLVLLNLLLSLSVDAVKVGKSHFLFYWSAYLS
jgi:hypothetical protein